MLRTALCLVPRSYLNPAAARGEGCLYIARLSFSGHRSSGFSALKRQACPVFRLQRLMLDRLRQFIADVVSPVGHENRTFADGDYRLAAAALLIHVISLDGEPSKTEKDKLHSLLEYRFNLDPGTADKLIADATLVEGEAVDLYHFTSIIMREVNDAGRLRIIEMMWQLVYADGYVSEFEDNIVWRAADLLGISSRDRINLKHSVADSRLTTDPAQ
jgi:uncharacterized tellurite resistance protein B-like protein